MIVIVMGTVLRMVDDWHALGGPKRVSEAMQLLLVMVTGYPSIHG